MCAASPRGDRSWSRSAGPPLRPENRAVHVDSFDRVRPTRLNDECRLHAQYEAWIEQRSRDFYADLLRKYVVADSRPWSLF